MAVPNWNQSIMSLTEFAIREREAMNKEKERYELMLHKQEAFDREDAMRRQAQAMMNAANAYANPPAVGLQVPTNPGGLARLEQAGRKMEALGIPTIMVDAEANEQRRNALLLTC